MGAIKEAVFQSLTQRKLGNETARGRTEHSDQDSDSDQLIMRRLICVE